MPRISQLPSLTVPDSGDELAIVDTSAATTKKISRTDFLKGAPLPTDTVTTAAIQDGAVTAPKLAQSAIDLLGSYSLTEVATPYTWVDGKTIYKKTINVGALPNSTLKTVAHGITALSSITSYGGYAYDGTTFLPIPYISTGAGSVSVGVNSTDLRIQTASNMTAYSICFIALFYTK